MSLSVALSVSPCCNLISLSLGQNSIDAEGIAVLFGGGKPVSKNVTPTLKLSTGAGLSVCESLATLNLSCNSMGDEGAAVIATALSFDTPKPAVGLHRTLTSLNLDTCEIAEQGSMQMAIMLHSNTVLESLSMSMNNVGSAAACEFAGALTKDTPCKLRELHLTMSNIGTDGAASLVAAMKLNAHVRVVADIGGGKSALDIGDMCETIFEGTASASGPLVEEAD
jgi:hypothetical protein